MIASQGTKQFRSSPRRKGPRFSNGALGSAMRRTRPANSLCALDIIVTTHFYFLRFFYVVGFCLCGILLTGCKTEQSKAGDVDRTGIIPFETAACPVGAEVLAPQQTHFNHSETPYMVYTAAGDHNYVMHWFSCGVANFKIYVSFYGQDVAIEKQLHDVVKIHNGLFEAGMHGFKDSMFQRGWKISKNPTHAHHLAYRDFFHGVQYFALIDDDITFSANEFNLFFDINRQLGLCFSGPSFVRGKLGWFSQQHVSGSLFRAGAAVECNTKTFRSDCLDAVMEAYIPELVGYGSEDVTISILHQRGLLNEINNGVIDAVIVDNPPARDNGKREAVLIGDGDGGGKDEFDSYRMNHFDLFDFDYINHHKKGWDVSGYCSAKYRIPLWVQYQLEQVSCSD